MLIHQETTREILFEEYLRDLMKNLETSGNYDGMEEWIMDPMDLIRDKFSQDRTIDTVLHIVMVHFNLSEKEAQTKINAYFKIVKGYSK